LSYQQKATDEGRATTYLIGLNPTIDEAAQRVGMPSEGRSEGRPQLISPGTEFASRRWIEAGKLGGPALQDHAVHAAHEAERQSRIGSVPPMPIEYAGGEPAVLDVGRGQLEKIPVQT